MNYRMTDIQNFVSTSTCRTIIEAATKLEISQPALSESLKRLESDAHTILFYRSRSGIQLTPSGKVFLTKAENLLQAFRELSFVQDDSRIFAGRTIAIGCHTVVAQYSLPKAINLLSQWAPDYDIQLHHDLSRNIQLDVQRGRLDIGIVINPGAVPDVVIQKLGYDEVSVWAPKKFSKLETLVCNQNLFQTQSILKKWKDRPERIISSDSLELLCHMVSEGVGYGIIPERAVHLAGLKLSRQNDLPTYKDEIALVYRPEFGKIKAEKLVLDALKAAITN